MSVMTIKLAKAEGTPWGFRLQGGKDFATPLCVQKVNGGSVAATAGLQAGDAIVSINGKDALALRHKEAQEAIVKAGNVFDLVIQRGARTWKPQVTPLAQVKTTPEGVPVVTSTSLAATKKYVAPVGTGHNTVALPFAEVNGQQIVNAQYNTPLNLYSDDNIAETLSAQAEVLGKGCLGINFKKFARETKIQTESPTYKLIHGDGEDAPKKTRPPPISPFDKEAPPPAPLFPRPKPAAKSAPTAQPPQQGGESDSLLAGGESRPAGTRSVLAPETKVKPQGVPSPSQINKCSECERPLTGVFVRIKNKNLHADCFKCSTCGSSLKNVGYYNINEKLYCDVHAKQAARHNPPAPNLEPVVVKPGAPLPTGAMTASMAKVASVPAPAPAPFKPPAGGVRILPASSALAPAPMPKFAPVPPPKPPLVPAPAPAPILAPAAPMAAPPSTTVIKGPAAPMPQKAPFGAPAGSVDVRSHIPKKGVPFVWPPPKNVEAVEEGPRSPAWAPAGEPCYVPRPKHVAGPLPKRPPLLPTPPPPKDYDTMVIKAPPPTQQPAEPAKVTPAAAPAPAPAPAPRPAPAPASRPAPAPASRPAPAPVHAAPPACNIPATPGKGKIEPPKPVPITEPMPAVNMCAPTPQLSAKQPATPKVAPPKQNAAKPAASKPISGYKSVVAPKPVPKVPSSNVGFKHVIPPGQKTGPAPGAPSRLAPAPISAPAPAPKPAPGPAAAPAPAPMPKPAAPKPPAPTGPAPAPAPVFAPAPSMGMPKPTPMPDLGGSSMRGVAQTGGQRTAPRRGRGVMNPSTSARIPICADCTRQIRGPFVSALGKTWCPDHFVCSTESCRKALIDMGFVEEQGSLYCEDCYEKYFAPICGKCDKRVKGDCLNAVGKQFHPECFCCAYCGKVFGSGAFYLEDGLPYCEADWNDLFTTKCVGCGFPIEAGDRWVEALNNNYHSQCFKCSKCHKNLEGQSFFAKGGKPFCKAHAQRGF